MIQVLFGYTICKYALPICSSIFHSLNRAAKMQRFLNVMKSNFQILLCLMPLRPCLRSLPILELQRLFYYFLRAFVFLHFSLKNIILVRLIFT